MSVGPSVRRSVGWSIGRRRMLFKMLIRVAKNDRMRGRKRIKKKVAASARSMEVRSSSGGAPCCSEHRPRPFYCGARSCTLLFSTCSSLLRRQPPRSDRQCCTTEAVSEEE
ncbi:hypothetical protein L596_004708 [Steinernema carpocapsae]|uniref:Uncharacterized protein n=1 Tax=Steinernema carpocapsae TaxID=34508 RepID=A0A4V6I8F0_STECR|nr:hypothetical protein L596_004708 [Steinernema carpocapsae]